MKKLIVFLLAATLLCLPLAACSTPPQTEREPSETSAPAPEGADEETPEPTPESAQMPTDEATPAPVQAEEQLLRVPGGGWAKREDSSLDLSRMEQTQLRQALALMEQMPNLHTVDLGADRALSGWSPADGEDGTQQERLSWELIRRMQELFPGVDFVYRFQIAGKSFTTLDETMDLNHREMDDEGAAVRQALPCMTRCTYLDMDFCGVSDEAMAAIRDDFPQIEVVWRIWFGRNDRLSVRTDVERILASDGGYHIEYHEDPLQYCTKVKYLDVGHMPDMYDWSFLGYMPELEVVVISVGGWEGDDLAGLANCPHLEYLEMCSRSTRGVLDLSFLAGLTELKHLNICCCYEVTGYEALENLTGLERLWIGKNTYIPEEYIEHLRQVLPNTEINVTSETGVGGGWRWVAGDNSKYTPRYALLYEQFQYGDYDRVCALYWNDPLYKPHD